jgi:hypothetical protein
MSLLGEVDLSVAITVRSVGFSDIAVPGGLTLSL